MGLVRRRHDVLVRRPPGAPPPRDWRVTADKLRHRTQALVRQDPTRAVLLALAAGFVVGRLVRRLLLPNRLVVIEPD